MTIELTDILTQVQMLSAFEGRRIVDANGQSMFEEVLVTEQDSDFISHLVDDCCTAIHAAARYAFNEVVYDDGEVTLTFNHRSAMAESASAEKVATEVVSAYVMQHWLEDKSAERSKAYEQMFADLLASLVRLAHSKRAPKLEDYDD